MIRGGLLVFKSQDPNRCNPPPPCPARPSDGLGCFPNGGGEPAVKTMCGTFSSHLCVAVLFYSSRPSMSLQLYVASSMAATTKTHYATPTTQRCHVHAATICNDLNLLRVGHCNVSPCYFFNMQRNVLPYTVPPRSPLRSSTCCPPTTQPSTCNCISSVPVVTASMPCSTFIHCCNVLPCNVPPRNVPP